MRKQNIVKIEVELSEPETEELSDRSMQHLTDQLIMNVLPQLAERCGIAKHRLAGALLVELGYVVGLSHTPAAAVDALTVATERLREALATRRDRRPTLPAPNIAGPATLQ